MNFMKRNILLISLCVLSAAMIHAEGLFSVSATDKVAFAPGNLQFHMMDSTWRFAPNQYDWMGLANLEMGNPNYNGYVDLFGWSVGESNNYGATSNNDTLMCANKDFVDWGTLFTDQEWFTLSHSQWDYVLGQRAGANDKWGMAKIGDTLGMILLPDTWVAPEGIVFVPRNVPTSELWSDNDMIDATYDHYRVKNDSMPANLFTIAQWEQMETAGAVFLPYAGRRSGGYGNYLNYYCDTLATEYNYTYYENYLGTYWTSTSHNRAKGQADYIYTFKYTKSGQDEFYDWGRNVIWSENGRYGQSVRLARIVDETHTDIRNTELTPNASKRFVNGQLLIDRNGETYSITGQRML